VAFVMHTATACRVAVLVLTVNDMEQLQNQGIKGSTIFYSYCPT